MNDHPERPIAIYFEHPDWLGPLFDELNRRDMRYVAIDARKHWFDPAETEPAYALVVNRVSQSAYERGSAGVAAHTGAWLRHLERLGVPIVNGPPVFGVDVSKARQIEVLADLGLPHPRTRIASDIGALPDAAADLRFPVLVKPNVGGAGSGIQSFETLEALRTAVDAGALDLGPDGVGLAQEQAPLRDGFVTRVEVLNGAFLYAIRVYPGPTFNLCPNACRTDDRQGAVLRAARASPPPMIVEEIERIARAIQLDVGGIEYLSDARDGRHYYFDINALSNFVAGAEEIVGFDPVARFVDYLEWRRAEAPVVTP